MRVIIVCPARPRSRHGNRVTALRWAGILRKLGHRVRLTEVYHGERCDLLIALHAKKSAPAAERFRELHPEKPLIVALTGTDLYRDIRASRRARRVLDLATRLVVLQPLGVTEFSTKLGSKARVVFQSARKLARRTPPSAKAFEVCVIGHLRPEKDPFRTALASRLLPKGSRIRVTQVGKAMSDAMERRARLEAARNPRYRWLGERPRGAVRAILARSRLMVLSSRLEGGANVVSEALAAGTPILASRIPGSVGLLDRSYPGFFEPGDGRGLAALLRRAETDPRFYARLAEACARRAFLAAPPLEERSWRKLLDELNRQEREEVR